MKITYEEMRDIATRLPVGYYLGRKVPVIVEPSGGAYCDTVKCEIHIGMSLLAQAASHITAADAAKWDREKMLRCVLYHEVGHVLLTPKWLSSIDVAKPDGSGYFPKRTTGHDILNIFEDERLERMLSAFFIGVDFNGFVHLVNGGNNSDKTVTEKLYNAIRLRKTTPAISAEVDDVIQSLVGIGGATDAYDKIGSALAYSAYAGKVNHLVKLILDESEKEQSEESGGGEQQQQQQQSGGEQQQSDAEQEKPQGEPESGGDSGEDEGDKSEEKSEDADKSSKSGEDDADGEDEDKSNGEDEGNSEDESNGEDSGGDEGKSNGKGEDEAEDDEHGDGDDGDADEDPVPAEESGESEPPDGCQKPRPVIMPSGALKTLAGKIFSTPTSEVAKTLGRFAQRISKKKGAQAAGRWSALHGKIDTRRDAMDKERIFRRSSDVGERLMSAVNLTLWVDHSGSFRGSKDVLNQILAATATAMKMSGGKLAVNVVKMEEYATVADEHDWAVNPDGDNAINNSYVLAWERTRRRDRRNIDIVVFDGVCSCSAHYLHRGRSLESVRKKLSHELDAVKKMWDSPDCWILSDTDNQKLFDAMAPKSHRTYMKSGYATQLQAKVIEILDRIL